MKLSQFKQHLNNVLELHFVQPNGTRIPAHFHITEAGLTTKHFVDCGGALRTEKTVSFQIWSANDFDHRLAPQKLKEIIDFATPLYGNEDLDIEIEYQMETISRFGLEFNGHDFLFTTKQTNCLAKDHCGIPQEKPRVKLADAQADKNSCCPPNSNCS